MRRVSRQALALVLCCVLVAGSTLGCASLEEAVKAHPKTAVGAAAGAVGGLLLGGLIFQSTTGALAGGLIGTLAGGLIGNAMESPKRDYPTTAQAYAYTPAQGTLVRIEKVEAHPSTVRPGETVHLLVHYALLTPDPAQEVSVTERREISVGGRLVGNPVLTVRRKGGTWASDIPLTLPANAETGGYRVAVAVQANGGFDSATTTFTVK